MANNKSMDAQLVLVALLEANKQLVVYDGN